MQKNIFVQFSLFIKKIFLLLFLSSFFLTGCLPEEKATNIINNTTTVNLVPDFLGITAAQTLSASKIKVTWIPSSDSNVVAYNVYDYSVFFNPVLIKTVSAPASETNLTNLDPQRVYSLVVKAYSTQTITDENGDLTHEDSNSLKINAIPYAGILPAQVTSGTTATILYTDASDADSVKIYCKTSIDISYSLKKTVTNMSLTQTNITGLVSGTEYTCKANLVVGTAEDNNLETTVFTPIGQAYELVFSSQPTSATAGISLPTQPVVQIKDASGNIVTTGPDATAVVTLTLSSSSPTVGTVRGTASVTAVAGVATFTGINFQEAGVKILTATKAATTGDYSTGEIIKDSSSFTISAGAVSSSTTTIAISPEVSGPVTKIANGTDYYTVNITLKDQYGNPVSGIKPQFVSSITGDTLSQPSVNSNALGISSGTISTTIADSLAPFRMLSISSPSGLTSVQVAAPFIPGTPSKLAFTTQPVNSPSGALGMATVKVAVQDAQGNTIVTGVGATANVTVNIFNNTVFASLSGTTTVAAVAGEATFNNLGISKTQTGFKLLASSGGYIPAYSNNFNITAGTPSKIILSGSSSVKSGVCSTITLQLQDNGSNAAGATATTPITLSGMGSGSIYLNNNCSGSSISSVNFSSGSHTKTLSFKDTKSEALNITASDPSLLLTTGTLAINSTPSKISLLAQMPSPAAPGTAMSVLAGACTPAITLTATGENDVAGPLFTATGLSLTGLGSFAQLYTDSGCTTVVSDPTNVIFPITTSAPYSYSLYIKDNKAETLSLNILDLTGGLSTSSSLQTVTVLASKINLTGPTTVLSGSCSTVYTVTLMDELNNPVVTTATKTLNISGLSSSLGGKFYTASNCSDLGSSSTVAVGSGVASAYVYLKDPRSESLSISLNDPLSLLTTSQTISAKVSPASLAIQAPSPAYANTSICAGPFTVRLLDSTSVVSNALSALTANLSGAGTYGSFYNSSDCSSTIASLSFSIGDNAKTFYLKSHVPSASMTITATDPEVDTTKKLATGTVAFALNAAPAWIGNQGAILSTSGLGDQLLGFRTPASPVSMFTDAPSTITRLTMDPTKQYLYVLDGGAGRVLKYDYLNQTYIGWIGGYTTTYQGMTITKSNLVTPSTAACVSTPLNTVTPGWCVGGSPYTATGVTSRGMLYTPNAITEDGTYLYVLNQYGGSVTRYNATTGAFDGWIGRVATSPTGPATGGPAGCTGATVGLQTPGWCLGGTNPIGTGQMIANDGLGTMYLPTAITNDGEYLYVANWGQISRYALSDGSFRGWIGKVGTTPLVGQGANTYTGTCSVTSVGSITPGWCVGGASLAANAKAVPQGGVNQSVDLKVFDGILYAVDPGQTTNAAIAKYSLDIPTSGAFLGLMTSLPTDIQGPGQLDFDNTYFYLADTNRVLKLTDTGMSVGWIGKVATTPTSTAVAAGDGGDAIACTSLSVNGNTPIWCLGGTSKSGLDETSFNQTKALVLSSESSVDKVLVGQTNFPALKKFSSINGNYEGTLSATSTAPTTWSNNSTSYPSVKGYDDNSYDSPYGIYNDGTYLFVVDQKNQRVKKIVAATGEVVGWVGGHTSSLSGGESPSTCTAASPMAVAPGWCTGGMPGILDLWGLSLISQNTNGILYQPWGITGDSNYLYVTDIGVHRIVKINKTTGLFVGWIGQISVAPTGGALGCNGASSGFTPGWCTGGMSAAVLTNSAYDTPPTTIISVVSSGFYNPTGIVAVNGNIYVVDNRNERISSFNSTTGAHNGWIGRHGTTAPTVCSSTPITPNSEVVSLSGWCVGGKSSSGLTNDTAGAFVFDSPGLTGNYGNIYSDGNYLYITHRLMNRVDKFDVNTGAFVASLKIQLPNRSNPYTEGWITTRTSTAVYDTGWGVRPLGVWVNSTHMYVVSATGHVFKYDLSTGNLVGWRGGISVSPVGGDTNCNGATVVTPGWCTYGTVTTGLKLGQFYAPYNITGDSNFIYITDVTSGRVQRLPK